MEKRNNTPGVLFQRIQCGSEAGLQILLVFHRLLSDAVVLDLVPNLFVRVVFRCPLWQEEHPQLAPVRPHIITHLLGMVEGGMVGQHDQWAFSARNQSAQKPDIPFPVDRAVLD